MLSKVLNSSTGAPCAAAHIVNSWGLQVLPRTVVHRTHQCMLNLVVQFAKLKYWTVIHLYSLIIGLRGKWPNLELKLIHFMFTHIIIFMPEIPNTVEQRLISP